MSDPKLVLIDVENRSHTIFEGRKQIQTTKFTRVLLADEVEDYRADHVEFLRDIEQEDSSQVSNG